MRSVGLLVWIAAVAASVVCVRLGFWQLSRRAEKRALNAALAEAERAPALPVTGDSSLALRSLGRAIAARGRFDERFHFLLVGREHEGAPGVEVVTPLRIEGSAAAILVNRGWLPADDAVSAQPLDYPEPGTRSVRGIAQALRHGVVGPSPRRLPGGPAALWAVRALDRDSIAARLPYPIVGVALRELPGPDVPALPRRFPSRRYDESMHLGYAIQWFAISLIILGGTAALAWSRRRRAAPRPIPEASS
jgi:surfeit locus 1 family protein